MDDLDLDLDTLNDSLADLFDSVPGLEDADLELDSLEDLTLVIGDADGALETVAGEASEITDSTSALELPEDPGALDPFLSFTDELEVPNVLILPNPFAS